MTAVPKIGGFASGKTNMEKKQVSVVIPVYNEEKTIVTTIEKIKAVLKTVPVATEIIAVDDGSSDRSLQLLKGLAGLTVIHHLANKGYGAALKTGIKAAQGEYILITDADGTYPLESIPGLLQYRGEYAMVVGARIGKQVQIPFFRRPAKWLLTKVANYIAGEKIPDINSGLRLFKKEVALEFWHLLPERFSFTITMTMSCHTKGYDVKYLPIDYYARTGKSTIRPFKDFIWFNKILLKLMLFFRPLKIFVPLSIGTGLLGILVFVGGWYYFQRIMDSTFVMISVAAIQFLMLGLIAELIVRNKT